MANSPDAAREMAEAVRLARGFCDGSIKAVTPSSSHICIPGRGGSGDVWVTPEVFFARAVLAQSEQIGRMRKALTELGHLTLGCDGHPCRVESDPLQHFGDMMARVNGWSIEHDRAMRVVGDREAVDLESLLELRDSVLNSAKYDPCGDHPAMSYYTVQIDKVLVDALRGGRE